MPITKAKRRARYTGARGLTAIRTAIARLKDARDGLRGAGCKNAADYVARALKSAEGAERHAQRMTIAGGARG